MMTICNAIRNRQLLSFTYRGHQRIVEPHTFGINKKGHYALRAYQVGGSSKSGNVIEWKLFLEKDMSSVSLLEERFEGLRDGYNRSDKAFYSIECQL